MFLQLFQLLSSDCAVLRQTWQRLQGLRDLHTKLGHTEGGTRTPHGIELGARAHPNSANSLSFDDIFPDADLVTTLESRVNFTDLPRVEAESQNPMYFAEGFVDLENLFDFPFLGFPCFGKLPTPLVKSRERRSSGRLVLAVVLRR